MFNNFHLKLNDNGILENASEQVNVDSDKEEEALKDEDEKEEKKEELMEKEDQEPVPSATDKAEACSTREQGEEGSKGEAEESEAVEKDNEDNADNDDSDEEVLLPVQKHPIATPRKSRTLASKGKSLVVDLDDDSTSHNTIEPTNDILPSPKQATPPSHQIPSPPPSPIPSSPPPVTTHTSPNHGFANTSVPTTPLYSILLKLNDLQSQFYAFQDEIRVFLASITDQLTQMEARLGAKLDTVEV